MGSIKPLPEIVRNSVRSGFILFDLATVVEELVFNSLDANATKVSVFVGVGTSYVKVVDNGTGITRDGLVLVGERYVTSKSHNLADINVASRSFGFRGEALASIADVSLLEIITKANGRPNGYGKVMKGCKCLYLGINDERKDVGTTVIVRDLFYNQPVRRKYMHSSSKKVLQSVKKCVFQVALVNPEVAFNVIDNESEDELLCTHPSSSSLSLVTTACGAEVSCALHEFDVDDDILKLSGYISGPSGSTFTKAFQYVYVNSRFVSKGPIHKLLNQLATRSDMLDPWEVDTGQKSRKRRWSQSPPAYLLNLICPRSFYDLTFEPTNTIVEFKDWVPILAFVERTVQKIWSKQVPHGEPFSNVSDAVKGQMWVEGDNDISTDLNFLDSVSPEQARVESKSRIQSNQAFEKHVSSPLKMVTEKSELLFLRERDTAELKQQVNKEFVREYDNPSWDGHLAKCTPTVSLKSEYCMWVPDDKFLFAEDCALETRLTAEERCNINVENDILSSVWENKSFQVDDDIINGSAEHTLPREINRSSVNISRDMKRPFLKICSFQGSFPLEGTLLVNDGSEFEIDGFTTPKRQIVHDYEFDILDHDSNNPTFDGCSRRLWLNEGPCSQYFSRAMMGYDIPNDVDSLPKDYIPSYREPFADENDSPFKSAEQVQNCGSSDRALNSECCSVTSGSAFWDIEDFPGERSWRADDMTPHLCLTADEEKNCEFLCDINSKRSREENYNSDCVVYGPSNDEYHGAQKKFYQFPEKPDFHKKYSPKYSYPMTDETRCIWLDLCRKYEMSTYKCKNQLIQFQNRDGDKLCAPEERTKRSVSAPPFYQSKRKFVSLDQILTKKAEYAKAREMRYPQQSSNVSNSCSEQGLMEDLFLDSRSYMKKMSRNMEDMQEIYEGHMLEPSHAFGLQDFAPNKDPVYLSDLLIKETKEPTDLWTKWLDCCPQASSNDKFNDIDNHNIILDISTGFLHLASDSLVPKFIDKNCLEDCKVLMQVDKKFIPVVAGRTLAVIDQHAADERIRLEELHQKVLSGEAKGVSYLDTEQALTLPEVGYQLLHNYAEHIKEWGWICNIHTQNSKTFRRNLNLLHKQDTVITLIAVPCILGVNLSDSDLLEFLHQLAETDGSSTMPQSVLRVLNSKACRGAIMFGDSLLPSECSLIVEELKQTRLCFQCAHGRPTTVPVVSLESLHKEIGKLGLLNDNSNEVWHGLRRHELNLERIAQRLRAAKV